MKTKQENINNNKLCTVQKNGIILFLTLRCITISAKVLLIHILNKFATRYPKMVLDLGIYFSEQFIVKRIGIYIITTYGGHIIPHKIQFKLSKEHLRYHCKANSKKAESIKRILQNPRSLLEKEHDLEAAFKTYLSIKSVYKYRPKLSATCDLEFLCELIAHDMDAWNELKKSDYSFYQELKTKMGFVGNQHGAPDLFREHMDFCVSVDRKTSFINDFGRRYKDMIMQITSGRKPEDIIDHPFYEECKFLLEYFSGEVKRDFKNMKTLNERGIRDFIDANSRY